MHTAAKATFALLASLNVAWASSACAHDFFLLPDDFTPEVGQSVAITATVSAAFPKVETTVTADRMAEKSARVGGASTPLQFAGSGTSSRLTHSPEGEGDAVLVVNLAAREVEYPHAQIETILHEYDLEGDAAAAARALPPTAPLRVSSSRTAKSVLCVRRCADHDDVRTPAGLPLEFVGSAAQPGAFVLLREGKPLPNHPVALVAADGQRRRVRTDAAGSVLAPVDRSGPVMLFAAVMERRSDPQARYKLTLSSLTVDAGSLR